MPFKNSHVVPIAPSRTWTMPGASPNAAPAGRQTAKRVTVFMPRGVLFFNQTQKLFSQKHKETRMPGLFFTLQIIDKNKNTLNNQKEGAALAALQSICRHQCQ